MSDQEAIAKLDVLIEFFNNYNKVFSAFETAKEFPLAA
jgi:hypothetical protein